MTTPHTKARTAALYNNWRLQWGTAFLATAVIMNGLHYVVFRDHNYLLKFILAQLGFLPISVFLVTVVLNNLMARREQQARLNKMNMVIGTFFSETGNPLLHAFVTIDEKVLAIAGDLAITGEWGKQQYDRALALVASHPYAIKISPAALTQIRGMLINHRQFLLGLLRNPTLLEHASFSELLWAVFHLTEELSYREAFNPDNSADMDHLAKDIVRAYRLLLMEWLAYVEHLQNDYPYLFSLAIRTNPFNQQQKIVFG